MLFPSLSVSSISEVLFRFPRYEDIRPLPDDVQGGEAWVVYCSKNGSDYVAKMKPIDNNVLVSAGYVNE